MRFQTPMFAAFCPIPKGYRRSILHQMRNVRPMYLINCLGILLLYLLAASCSSDRRLSVRPNESDQVWSVETVVDGDTLWVTNTGGNRMKIRLIGIDTPERGDCGFSEAGEQLERLLSAGSPTLTAGASSDKDKYDRLLRYIDVSGVDVGLELIRAGYAIAKYDSRDGYGSHTREAAYVSADAASPNFCK